MFGALFPKINIYIANNFHQSYIIQKVHILICKTHQPQRYVSYTVFARRNNFLSEYILPYKVQMMPSSAATLQILDCLFPSTLILLFVANFLQDTPLRIHTLPRRLGFWQSLTAFMHTFRCTFTEKSIFALCIVFHSEGTEHGRRRNVSIYVRVQINES